QVGGVAEGGANLIWLAYGWFTFAGLCLHGTRFLLADQTTRRLESAYVRRHANRSSKDAALGSEVKDASPSVVLRLTRSTDWDRGRRSSSISFGLLVSALRCSSFSGAEASVLLPPESPSQSDPKRIVFTRS